MSENERSAPRRDRPSLVDLAFFAPLGLALDASQLVPDLAERGRRELQRQVDSAALVGRLALRYGPAFVGGATRGFGRAGPGRPAGSGGHDQRGGPTSSGGRTEPGAPRSAGGRAEPGAPRRAGGRAEPGAPRTGRGRAEPGRVASSGGRPETATAEPVGAWGPDGEPAVEAGALAIPGYDALSALQVVGRLGALRPDELEAVAAYERTHRARRTILAKVSQLAGGTAPGDPANDSPVRTLLGDEGKSPP